MVQIPIFIVVTTSMAHGKEKFERKINSTAMMMR